MKSFAGVVLVPLMIAAFIYLAIIIPVETFGSSLATDRFKRKMFGLSVLIACALLFFGCGVKIVPR